MHAYNSIQFIGNLWSSSLNDVRSEATMSSFLSLTVSMCFYSDLSEWQTHDHLNKINVNIDIN